MEEKDPDFSLKKLPSVSQVLEEVKELWSLALPITGMNVLVYLRLAVSVAFLGRLGRVELAGGALSLGFTNITGYSVLMGLASGLDPVCSQAHGARNDAAAVRSLQRMVLILLAAAVPIAALWLNLEPIMLALGQDPGIAAAAAVYCRWSLPDLAAMAALQPLRVVLRSRGAARPMVYCTLAAVAGIHVPLTAMAAGTGVAGVAAAAAAANVAMAGMMGAWWWWGEGGRKAWRWRWPAGEDGEMGRLVALAVPSCLGICLEWWWYEIVTVMAGYLPDPTLAVAATGVIIQTTAVMYTVPLAISACVSTRVGNELGAGKPYKAKLAAAVALGCAFLIGFLNVAWTVVLRERWAGLFTKDDLVKSLVASVMPLIGLCELGNCPQTTGCGVLRGTARPAVAARVNLWSFYFVGTPVAVGLAFELRVGFAGLWFGLLAAQLACVLSVLYAVLYRTDWEAEALRAKKLAGLEMIVSGGPEVPAHEESQGFLANGNGNGNGNDKEDASWAA